MKYTLLIILFHFSFFSFAKKVSSIEKMEYDAICSIVKMEYEYNVISSIEKMDFNGFIVVGDYYKIINLPETSNMDSIIENMTLKTLKKMIKESSYDFIEPSDVWYWLRNNDIFCSHYVNIVGEAVRQMRYIKFRRKKIGILPYQKDVFRVKFLRKDNAIEEKYTLPFCILTDE